MPLNPNKHRYKHLLDGIKGEKVFYPSRLEYSVNESKQGKSIRFENFLAVSDFIHSFLRAVNLKIESYKIKPNTLVNYAIKENQVQHFYAMILKEKSVSKAIKKLTPQAIFFTTANTYPFARIVSRQAFLNKVPFHVVACRPMLINTRLEERLIKADLEAMNGAFVANSYAVWDKFSKNTLVEAGVDKRKIFVINKGKSHKPESSKEVLTNALLILFSHEDILNQRLINELISLNVEKHIIIRQHPLRKLKKEQLEQLSNKFKVIKDITSQGYDLFHFNQVMAITINSTAVLEAAKHGCGVIWLPYLNSRALIFFEVMQKIGKAFRNTDELKQFLNISDTTSSEFIKACLGSYADFFESKDQIKQFLNNLNK
jgi:hypothetical protein